MPLAQLTLFVLALFTTSLAQALDAQLEKTIKKALQTKLPQVEVEQINTTPINGLYEVYGGGEILYTDADGNFAILGGSLYDLANRQNLTEARTNKLLGVSWQALPLNLAIKIVKGNGSRKLAVFSDADCPYCKRLERSLAQLDNVTIYTFLYPIDELHPEAARKSKMIWCSPDRNKAWDDYMLRDTLTSASPDCDNPIAKTQELGKKFRIRATPTLVLENNKLIPGALPKEQIELELGKASETHSAKSEDKATSNSPSPTPKTKTSKSQK